MGDIDEVKSRINIADVIAARVTLKKAGRHLKGLCPFHSEKTPSFIVSPERSTWHCFGCGKGGSVIDFVMEYEHVDFVEALETLAQKAGVKLERRQGDTPEAKTKQKIYEVNHLASEYYHYLLTKHELGQNARLYLKSRDITDKSIKTFMLGYSPNSWDGLLKYLTKKGYEGGLLEQAGLVIRTQNAEHNDQARARYYDRFRGRVIFTLKDHRGNIVGFSGRQLDQQAKEAKYPSASSGREQPKYINTSETPVYNKSNLLYGLDVTKDAIIKENQAVVMEGEFDVISSFQAGIGNVVAIKGSALTEGHVHLLKRFAEKIVLALDSDMAGDAASRRGIAIADKAELEIRVASIPTGKDPDEAVRESPGLLKKFIKEAEPIYDYFISSAVNRFDVTTAYGKKKISDELLPILSQIENSIIAEHYIKRLATVMNTSEDAIRESMRKNIQPAGLLKKKEENFSVPTLNRHERLEVYTLALLLQGKTVELFDEVRTMLPVERWMYPPVRQIITHLGEFLIDHRIFFIKDFADTIPAELLPSLDMAFLWDIQDLVSDEEKFTKEWITTLRCLQEDWLRVRIAQLSQSLKAADSGSELAEKLEGEINDATKALTVLVKSVSF